MKTYKAVATLLFATTSLMTMAQGTKLFTLEDLIPGGGTYRQTVPETAYTEWWGDKCIRLDIEECRIVDNKTGDSKTLFTLSQVNDAIGKTTFHHLYNVSFPLAGQTIALLSQNGKYWHFDWLQKRIVWSVDIDPEAAIKEFNTISLSTAYTKDYNLYVADDNGNTTQVSTDGSIDIVYGEAVHRNEFGIEKGMFWSPKGRYLAFYRMNQSMVTAFPQVDMTTRCATVVPDKYPMAGEASHKVTVGIYDTKGKKTIYLDAGDPTDRYFTNIAWSPDESTVYMIELNRDQNHAQLVAYDAATGKRTGVLVEEKNSKYVEPSHPIQFLPWDSSKFIYQSRNEGYNHIYLYSADGTLIKKLTDGEFEVIDVLGFNEKKKTIVYTSNEANPIGKSTWSVDMKGRRTAIGSKEGWHNPTLSASGTYITDNYSSPEIARKIDIIPTNGGKALNLLTAKEPWDEYKTPKMEVGTIKAADGVTDLYYRLVLPTDFDPTKKYPAIVYVYGGPHAHNIDASRHWGVRGWDIWMAQKGYVMFCLDNRGSEHRGLAFEQATFRNLGVEEMKDQLKGVDYLKSLPYVDGNRLGVHGWSFGGFMTTSLMTTYPDVFKVGVAGGPVIDWKYYEVMYGERYMDTPQSNPEGYKNTSLLNKAGNLKGRLMVIHGGNDPVCVPQHTYSFLRACIDAGTHPDLFFYPGDGHNMMGTDRIHLHEHISRYFDDYLK
ncbi:MAG: DPP IV N-terminal domain-containing protein [Bacteroidaceae bacterium]|nr:DPP IV N-terminal domain-containing protein [Bacteroidaceae bacterium]